MRFRIPKWKDLDYSDYKEIEEAYLRVWRGPYRVKLSGGAPPRASHGVRE